jgi:branched-chain amino acid transport system substrate-binding protein
MLSDFKEGNTGMKKIIRIAAFSLLALLIFTIPILGACTESSQTSSQTSASPSESTSPQPKILKIGDCEALSGPPSAVGMAFKKTYQMFFDKINEQGGVKIGPDTYKIQFFCEDNGCTPGGATTATSKLIYEDGCTIVLGSLADFLTVCVTDVASKAGVLHAAFHVVVSGNVKGSLADISPDKPLFIRLGYTADESFPPVFQYLTEAYPNVKKVAFLNQDFPDYKALNPLAEALCREYGLTPGASEFFPEDTVDFHPFVTRLLEDKPDAIFLVKGAPSHYIMEVKQIRELGFTGPIFWADPVDPADPAIIAAAGPVSDVFSTALTMSAPNLPASVMEIKKSWEARYTDPFISDSLFAWDSVNCLVQLLEKAGSTDPQKLMETFETLTEPGSLQSIWGPAQVGGLKTYGVNRALVTPIPLSRAVEGKGEYVRSFPLNIP